MKELLESIIVGGIGGALAGAATVVGTNPVNWRAVATSAAVGAITTAAALWRNRPGAPKC